ncbi:MAG: MBL fold metallo-hydrolase, partial [Clostridia bacterium]
MVKLCTLSSGSSGNAVFVQAEGTKILIDCGIAGKAAADRLCAIGVDPSELSAILVTHEHVDHIRGVGVMSRRFNLPIYASMGTWNGMIESIGNIAHEKIHYIAADVPFAIDDAVIFPFATSHDANESLGFTVSNGHKSVSLATDLGMVDKYVYDNVKNSDLLVLEANHDEQMLMNGPYPQQLKKRIFSDCGHLSNKVCGALCGRILSECGDGKRILLGHLSKDNNTPEVAFETVRRSVEYVGGKIGSDIFIDVAGR